MRMSSLLVVAAVAGLASCSDCSLGTAEFTVQLYCPPYTPTPHCCGTRPARRCCDSATN